MSDGGKGSKPRPFSISHEEWSKRWDAIFARDLDEPIDKSQDESSLNKKEEHAKDIK